MFKQGSTRPIDVARRLRAVLASTALALMIPLTATAQAENVGFQAGPTTSAPGNTAAMVTADFNGDKNADVAVADAQNDSVDVALGDGDGTFGTFTKYSLGSGNQPVSLAVGNFKGGVGEADLVVSYYDNVSQIGGVAVLLGKGDGTFAAPAVVYTTTASTAQPVAVATGDFNDDGKQDVAFAYDGLGGGAGGVDVLIGNGDGTFASPTTAYTAPSGKSPTGIATGDFTGSGYDRDLAIANSCGPLAVVEGNGDGTFKAASTYSGVPCATSVVTGHFSGTADQDIAASQSSYAYPSYDNTTYVLKGNGTGRFSGPTTSSFTVPNSDGGGGPLVAGDFNVDGHLSLASAGFYTAPYYNAVVLPGNGDGTFGSADIMKLPFGNGSAQAVAVADLNGDGLPDLLVAQDGTIYVEFSTGGLAVSTPTANSWTNNNKPTISGTAGTGGSWGSTATVNVYSGSAPSGTPVDTFSNVSIDSSTGDWSVSATSFSSPLADGQYTVQATQSGPGGRTFDSAPTTFNVKTTPPQVTLSSPANNSTTSNPTPPLVCTGSASSGDNYQVTVNVYAGSQASGTPVSSMTVNEADCWAQPTAPLAPGTYTAQASQTDQAGNIGYSTATFTVAGSPSIRLSAAPGSPITMTNGQQPVAVATGDFNRDGKPDLAIADGNDVSIALGKGGGQFGAPTDYGLATTPTALAVGDFNGDHKLDVAALAGTQVYLLLGNGDGTLQAPQAYAIPGGYSGTGIVAEDFNSDGNADLAISVDGGCCDSPPQSGVAILLGNGNGSFDPGQFEPYYTTANRGERAITGGDFNADSKPDVATAGGISPPGVASLLGNGDGTLQSPSVTSSTAQYGYGTQSLAAGDLNGDGKTDLVMEDSSGCGSCLAGSVDVFLGNGDGTFQPPASYSVLDNSGDYVGLGDLNGDGKTDIAVTNPQNSLISVLPGKGDGTFGGPINVSDTHDPSGAPAVADVNGDGLPDLIVPNGDGTVSVLLANPQSVPTPTLSTPTTGSVTNQSKPTFMGNGGTQVGVSVAVDVYSGNTASGTPVQTLAASRDASGNFSVQPSSALSDGTYTAQAVESDAFGDSQTSQPATFTVDTTPPTISLTSPRSGSTIANEKPTFSGTAGIAPRDQSTVTVNVFSGYSASGTPVQTLTTTAGGSGGYSVTSSSPLSPGTYTAQASQGDAAGNVGTSTPATFTIVASPISVAFTPTPASPSVGKSVAFDAHTTTDLVGGTITSYIWDFGDGSTQTTTDPSATHMYSMAGAYTVTLTALDNLGNTGQEQQPLSVGGSTPNPAFTTVPSGPTATGTPIQFDGTKSTDAGSTISSYSWDFGDGSSSTLPSPSHAYATAGTYPVKLTVTDAAGQSRSVTQPLTVTDRPPTAAFNPTQATVLTGSAIRFDGTQSNDPDGTLTGYSWNFGDDGTSGDAQPSHGYSQPGTYTVILTVTDNSGNTSTTSHQITVIAPPPVQTLIETIAPAPQAIKSAPPSVTRAGLVDLGQRLFCPGSGPSCRTIITATSASLARDARAARKRGKHHSKPKPKSNPAAGGAVITVAPNGSAELAFRLSAHALKTLRQHKRLALRVTIVSTRGAEETVSTVNLVLKLPAKKKR